MKTQCRFHKIENIVPIVFFFFRFLQRDEEDKSRNVYMNFAGDWSHFSHISQC